MRTREVWLHAVDLNNGGRISDFPAELIDLLLDDLIAVWRRKRVAGSPNVILEPVDRDRVYEISDERGDDSIVVRGDAVSLVTWGTGRGAGGVLTADGSPAPAAPGWL
jgi:maleylpyruvate isomerase